MTSASNIGRNTLGGAMSGASAGSAAGPWGALGGGIFGGILGFGMSGDEDSTRTAQGVQVDPDDPRFQYGGGQANGLTAGGLASMGGRTDMREAPTTNYGQANDDYARSLAARAQQEQLAGRLTGILDGTGPATQAQLQLAQGNRDAIAAGQQMAASARGTNALIQSRTANVGAVLGAQRAGEEAAMLRAREEAQARGELAGLLGGMRTQDMGSRSESAGQAQFGTQTQMEQRRMNDAKQLGLFGLSNDIAQSQLDANIRVAQGNQGATNANGQFNASQQSATDQRERAAQAGFFNGMSEFGSVYQKAKGNQQGGQQQPGGSSNSSNANSGYGNNPYTDGGGPPPKAQDNGEVRSSNSAWGMY